MTPTHIPSLYIQYVKPVSTSILKPSRYAGEPNQTVHGLARSRTSILSPAALKEITSSICAQEAGYHPRHPRPRLLLDPRHRRPPLKSPPLPRHHRRRTQQRSLPT